jgi:hypothetical protein
LFYSEVSFYQVEVVEGVPDLTEQLFPQIPPDVEKRPRLTTESLTLLRKACVYYCQNAAIPGETAKYSRMFRMFFKNSPNNLGTKTWWR